MFNLTLDLFLNPAWAWPYLLVVALTGRAIFITPIKYRLPSHCETYDQRTYWKVVGADNILYSLWLFLFSTLALFFSWFYQTSIAPPFILAVASAITGIELILLILLVNDEEIESFKQEKEKLSNLVTPDIFKKYKLELISRTQKIEEKVFQDYVREIRNNDNEFFSGETFKKKFEQELKNKKIDISVTKLQCLASISSNDKQSSMPPELISSAVKNGRKLLVFSFLLLTPIFLFFHIQYYKASYMIPVEYVINQDKLEGKNISHNTSSHNNWTNYLTAFHIHFLAAPTILCSSPNKNSINLVLDNSMNNSTNAFNKNKKSIQQKQSKNQVSRCKTAKNRMERFENNFLLQLLRVAWYFTFFFLIFRFIARLIEGRYIEDSKEDSSTGLEQDVIMRSANAIAFTFALLTALILSRASFSQIGIFSGLAAAGLSIALRETLGNLIAGMMLLWDKTITKGNVITLPLSDSPDTGGTYGVVKEMRMRYTIIEDRATLRRLVPNSLLISNTIENWTHENNMVRLKIDIGVAYGSDVRQVKNILESVCYDVPRIIMDKPPQAVMVGFGSSSLNFQLRFWIKDASQGIRPILSEVYMSINQRFSEVGIRIPFSQLDLHVKSIKEAHIEYLKTQESQKENKLSSINSSDYV